MASEIKVDTISEKTSAGGVTIDGLLIKDGNISGDVALAGTTPTFTIGDAGAEDAALVFDGNAKDFYIALDDSADKLVIGEGSTVGTNSILTITDDSVTVGDAAAVDTKIVFDGNAQDYHIGLDDSADTLVLGLGSTLGTTPAMTVNSSQVVTFAQNPVFPDGGVAVADLDIDGATDIGAAIVDADLFIVDDGAGGTNRKVTASRIKTYAGGAVTAINNATESELVTIGSTTTELDAEANLTYDGTTFTCNSAAVFNESSADVDFRIESNGNANMFFVDAGNNYVGIGGTTGPTEGMFLAVRDTTAADFTIHCDHAGNDANCPGLLIRAGTNAGGGGVTMIRFQDGDGTDAANITCDSGTVAYGTFTANHDAELPDEDNASGYPYGTLVSTTSIFYSKKRNTADSVGNGEDTIKGIRYRVVKSSSAYDKAVLGVYAVKHPPEPEKLWEDVPDRFWHADEVIGGKCTPEQVGEAKAPIGAVRREAEYQNLHMVYVLGDGHILCNDEKGDIAVGDGICTSSTEGEGMKADKKCMIIGIAQEAKVFGGESKLVAVQYGLQQFTPWD